MISLDVRLSKLEILDTSNFLKFPPVVSRRIESSIEQDLKDHIVQRSLSGKFLNGRKTRYSRKPFNFIVKRSRQGREFNQAWPEMQARLQKYGEAGNWNGRKKNRVHMKSGYAQFRRVVGKSNATYYDMFLTGQTLSDLLVIASLTNMNGVLSVDVNFDFASLKSEQIYNYNKLSADFLYLDEGANKIIKSFLFTQVEQASRNVSKNGFGFRNKLGQFVKLT